jgi:hypothetical protein
VRPVFVVVGYVVGQPALGMVATEDQHPVEALTTDGVDEALCEGIGLWRPDRGANDPDAFGIEDLIEVGRELGVSVSDQSSDGMRPLGQHHAQIAGLLDYPGSDRVGGDPGHVDPTGVEFDGEQHVGPAEQHRVDRREVTGQH